MSSPTNIVFVKFLEEYIAKIKIQQRSYFKSITVFLHMMIHCLSYVINIPCLFLTRSPTFDITVLTTYRYWWESYYKCTRIQR